jgi:hypothetical protein
MLRRTFVEHTRRKGHAIKFQEHENEKRETTMLIMQGAAQFYSDACVTTPQSFFALARGEPAPMPALAATGLQPACFFRFKPRQCICTSLHSPQRYTPASSINRVIRRLTSFQTTTDCAKRRRIRSLAAESAGSHRDMEWR